MAEVSVLVAFVAGVFSFTSPCCLPLVPIFLAHLAGVSVGESAGTVRRPLVAHALAYVLGFSLVFVALGLALGAAGSLVETASIVADNRVWLVRAGGAMLVLLGLHQLGLIALPYLGRERRLSPGGLPPRHLASSFAIGVTFGAGWSPCVGPILGAILTMAAGQGSSTDAAWLLSAYAAGLGVPFVLTALAFGTAPGVLRSINRRLHAVTSVSGGVMVAMGAILLLGIYQRLFVELIAAAPWTPWEPNV
jgi:cytochrome c-type biogenesis protein